jgi:hypothetical protein
VSKHGLPRSARTHSRAEKLLARHRNRVAVPSLPPIEELPPAEAFNRLAPPAAPQTQWIERNLSHPGLRPDGHMR